MKSSNSAFNAQGSRVIIIVLQVGAVKIYVVEAIRTKERQDETQFTVYNLTSVRDQRVNQTKGRSWRTHCCLVLAACHKLGQGDRILHELSKSASVGEGQGRTQFTIKIGGKNQFRSQLLSFVKFSFPVPCLRPYYAETGRSRPLIS